MAITFDTLPQAVSALQTKLDRLEALIRKLQPDKEIKELLTVDEAAAFLHLSKPTLYSKVSRKELPYMKNGKRIYFSRKELIEHLRSGEPAEPVDIKSKIRMR